MNFATVNGITVRYETTGSGRIPLVFINSLGTNLHIWDDVVAQLDGRRIQYDKRGHGLSDAPPAPYTMRDHSNDLLGLLDHLGVEQAILCGVSVGGMIALDFSVQFPERVPALVLCDTAGQIGNADGWNTRIAKLEADGMESMGDSILDRWFGSDVDEGMRAVGRNMLTRTPLHGYTGTCAAIRDVDLRPGYAKITMPTLVLCGAQDGATTPEFVGEFARSLPNATFRLIDGAGHLPMWERPDETAAAIRTFLNEYDTSTKFERGTAIRRAVLGDAHVDRATANITEFDADFQRFITEFAWGTAWAGGTIDRQTRQLITIAILAALGREHEFTLHTRATENTGVTPEQVKEALHQVAIYAGVPAANTAISIAKKIYAERGSI